MHGPKTSVALPAPLRRRKDRPDLRTAILPTLLKLRKKASGPGIPDGLGLPAPAGAAPPFLSFFPCLVRIRHAYS